MPFTISFPQSGLLQSGISASTKRRDRAPSRPAHGPTSPCADSGLRIGMQGLFGEVHDSIAFVRVVIWKHSGRWLVSKGVNQHGGGVDFGHVSRSCGSGQRKGTAVGGEVVGIDWGIVTDTGSLFNTYSKSRSHDQVRLNY